MTDKEIEKLMHEYMKLRVKCKCGHSMIIPMWMDKKLCNWCGEYAFRNKQLEFQENMKKIMKQMREIEEVEENEQNECSAMALNRKR